MAGHVAGMEEMRRAYRIFVRKPDRKSHSEDPGIDGRIILKLIFRKWEGGAWAGLDWLRIWTDGGLL
jgi:hypothetical protein